MSVRFRLWSPIGPHDALVARMDRPPSSKRTHAGSNPAESSDRIAQRREHPDPDREVEGLNPSAITKHGELAERQGIAVLTRRDLRVGQVRLLHSPPVCGSGIDRCASVFQTDCSMIPKSAPVFGKRSCSSKKRDRYSRPAPIRPVSLPARISVLQTEETGSTPVRGSNSPGCGSGPTDPPLKRRSARSAAHVQIVLPVPILARWRQFVGEQRLLITTASPDRHRGPLPPAPARLDGGTAFHRCQNPGRHN
jgi:hypothetical protein